MNKRWSHGSRRYGGREPGERNTPNLGLEPIEFFRKEGKMGNDDKNILVSKTAWVFVLLLIVGALKALGVVGFELADSEAEGIALGIVAIIGIVLRLVSSGRVHILPVNRR